MPTALPAVLATFALVAAGPAQELTLRRVDDRLPWRSTVDHRPAKPAYVRIVDGRSGLPIPGAALFDVHEDEHPVRGQFRSNNFARADDQGFIRMERKSGYWTIVDAHGYAVTGWGSNAPFHDGGILRLYPGVDVPIALRNHLGKLTPNAAVGYCVGCGHSPDVRFAITGQDGIAWLRGIWVSRSEDENSVDIHDLYPFGAELDGDYDSVGTWFPGDAPVTRYCNSGPELRGRVVNADGSKPHKTIVRQYERHRGPVADIDEQGNFRLVSPMNNRSVVVVVRGRQVHDMTLPPSEEITWHLPLEEGHPPVDPVRTVAVEIRLLDDETGQAIVEQHISATPRTCRYEHNVGGDTDLNGRITLEMPLGEVVLWREELVIGNGRNAIAYDTFEQVVEVTNEQRKFAVRLKPQRRVPFRLQGAEESEPPTITVHTRFGERKVEYQGQEGVLLLPSVTPSGIGVWGDHGKRVWKFDPNAEQDGPLVFTLPRPNEVRVTVRDESGALVEARVELRRAPGLGEAEDTETENGIARFVDDGTKALHGACFLTVIPARADLVPLVHRMQLPPRGSAAKIEAGITCTTAATARLTLSNPQLLAALGDEDDDAPLALEATLFRPGIDAAGRFDAKTGAWNGLEPQAGDWIVLSNVGGSDTEGYVRFRQRLDGAGPWRVTAPQTEVELTFVDRAGDPVEGVHLYVGDQTWRAKGDTFTLHHLPGPTEVTVAHPELGAGVATVDPAAGAVRVRFPPR